MRIPSHSRVNQPTALDCAVGARTIGGNTLARTGPSDLNAVYTDSAPVHSDLAPVHTAWMAVHTNLAPAHTDLAPVS